MHTTHSKPVNPESMHDGYEVTDANAGIIVMMLAIVAMMGAAAFPVVIWLVSHWDNTGRPAYNTTPKSPVAQPLDQVPPMPHLQNFPRADADAYLNSSREHLASYGIISEAEGMKSAHVPIEKAIDIIAKGQAAYRQQPTVATTTTPEATAAPEATATPAQ